MGLGTWGYRNAKSRFAKWEIRDEWDHQRTLMNLMPRARLERKYYELNFKNRFAPTRGGGWERGSKAAFFKIKRQLRKIVNLEVQRSQESAWTVENLVIWDCRKVIILSQNIEIFHFLPHDLGDVQEPLGTRKGCQGVALIIARWSLDHFCKNQKFRFFHPKYAVFGTQNRSEPQVLFKQRGWGEDAR